MKEPHESVLFGILIFLVIIALVVAFSSMVEVSMLRREQIAMRKQLSQLQVDFDNLKYHGKTTKGSLDIEESLSEESTGK